jgi:hypothetical protein
MSSYIFGAAAAAATAWGYLSYVQPITGAKYYVSQQLAQMQAHRFNKFNILKACRGDPRLTQLVTQIFEDYERDIEFTQWKWVKLRTGKWACIPAARAQRLRANQKFGGIFPPIASLESTVEACDIDIEEDSWLTQWKNVFRGFARGYFSNLENYVLQLEAVEQDMSAFAYKLRM